MNAISPVPLQPGVERFTFDDCPIRIVYVEGQA